MKPVVGQDEVTSTRAGSNSPRPALTTMNKNFEEAMPTQQYTRTHGQRLTYTIEYADGEYFIEREGVMKKSVPDAMASGMDPKEAKADLMLRMAIADIESLSGMD